MNKTSKHFRIISLAPGTRGVGFALLEGQETLVDWGVKITKGDKKNIKGLAKVKELIGHYQPDVLVLEDASAKGSRRSPRIRTLVEQIVKQAETVNMKTKLYSRDQVMQTLLPDVEGTKHALAEIMAQRFPEQLCSALPPKRKLWDSENYQMSVFDAVALAVTFRLKQTRRKQASS